MTNPVVPPYGVAIQEAIASGDLAKMQKVADQAESYLREVREIPPLLGILKQEIVRLGGPSRAGAADVVPYGDPMRAAAASGDLDRMKQMIHIAENWLAKVSDVQNALIDLKVEVARQMSPPKR